MQRLLHKLRFVERIPMTRSPVTGAQASGLLRKHAGSVRTGALVLIVFVMSTMTGLAQVKRKTIPLNDPNQMQKRNVKTEQVTFKGRKALRVTDTAGNAADGVQ